MTFRFRNAPAIFQRSMDNLLRDEIDENIVKLMIDDILIASKTVDEHFDHLRRIITKIGKANLKLNWKKCIWFSQEMNYAGHHITSIGITLQKKFQKKLMDIPRPKTRQQPQSLLGLLNYARKYIPNYASISKPLQRIIVSENLKEKENGFRHYESDPSIEWTCEQERAWEEVLRVLKLPLFLGIADHAKPYHVFTDASQYGAGWAFTQYCESTTTKGKVETIYHVIRCG